MGIIAQMEAFGVALLLLLTPVTAEAQDGVRTHNAIAKPSFSVPDGPTQILLFQPEVSVSEQTAGGLAMPNADWTLEARGNLAAALTKAYAARGDRLFPIRALLPADEPLMNDYRALFRAIVSAAFTHRLFPGDALPTKRNKLDWTLGPGAVALGKLGSGDFGLFIYTNDAYESRSRQAVETISGLLGKQAEHGAHFGYAGLVDLKTGDLVWVSANVQMTGDVRTKEGAATRASQLLLGFPWRVK